MMKFLHFNLEEQTRKLSQKLKKKYQSRTVAVEAIDGLIIKGLASDFLRMTSSDTLRVNVKVGVTMCSLHDRYSKSDGRKNAVEKMQSVEIKVHGIVITETHVFVHLEPYKGVNMSLRLNKTTGFTTVTGDFNP
jgi:hypothetical protein